MVLGTLAATRLDAQVPNNAPPRAVMRIVTSCNRKAAGGHKDEDHAEDHPGSTPDNNAQFRAMDQVCLLQDVGLVQPLHGGATCGQNMDMTFVDAGEQQIVHRLSCRL